MALATIRCRLAKLADMRPMRNGGLPMTGVEIELLGPFGLLVDGRPLTELYSDKVRALVSYLAAESGRPHRRETLAGLLWPDYLESSARQSLSQALFALRRALARAGHDDTPWLVINYETVALSQAPGCRVDVGELEALVEACRTHVHIDPADCPDCAQRLERAASLYRGEFLAGFSLPDSGPFEEWLLLQRHRCRRRAVEALEGLAAQGERRGEAAAALGHARRWVELEPLDEQGHRQIMRLLAVAGQRAMALAQYGACREELHAQLGAEPDTRTTALYERILKGEFPPRAAHLDDLHVRPPPFLSQQEGHQPPLFVAREEELARLQAHLDQMLAGRAQFAFVAGEAGCGKTALMQELARRAHGAHAELVVATGRCNAYTGIGDPYLAFREILAQLGGEIKGPWQAGAMGREQASRLWGLLPHTCLALAEVGPDLVDALIEGEALLARAELAASSDAAWPDRLRELMAARRERPRGDIQQPALFRQLTGVLQRLARAHPLLLILEDLHWADAGSLSLLLHLGTHLAAERILIVGAYRPASLPSDAGGLHPLETIVHEIQRGHGEIVVNLDQADGQGFVSALVDAEPNTLDGAFREALFRQAGGNALFTSELLEALRERGELVSDAEGRWSLDGAVRWDRLPARVEAVIAERVGGLPHTLQEALRVGSVQGETFTAEVVARVLGAEPLAFVRALRGAAGSRHGLIAASGLGRAQGRPLSSYRFRHILIQTSLYESMEPAERVYLHEAVGDSLVALHGDDDDVMAVQLARHYEEAGDDERAVAWLRQAGQRAMRLGVHAEAKMHYDRGLELLARLPESRERDATELGLQLGVCPAILLGIGAPYPGMMAAARRALALAERLQDPASCFGAIDSLLNYFVEMGEYQEAQEAGAQLVAWAQRTEDDGLIALALSRVGWAGSYVGDWVGTLRGGEALRAYSSSDDLAARRRKLDTAWIHAGAGVHSVAAITLVTLGYRDQALARLREGVDMARELDRDELIAHVAGAVAMVYIELRDFAQALPWATESRQRAISSGVVTFRLVANAHEGLARAHLGEVQEGMAQVRDSLAQMEARGHRSFIPGVYWYLGECYLVAGKAQKALEAAGRALALATELGQGIWLAPMHLFRGQALLRVNPPDAARAAGAMWDAIGVARRQEARLFELQASVALARLWQGQGKVAEARELLQPVYDWFTEGHDMPALVEARALLAELAA